MGDGFWLKMDADCCDEAISKRLHKQRATFCVSAVGLDGSPWGATWQIPFPADFLAVFLLQKKCKQVILLWSRAYCLDALEPLSIILTRLVELSTDRQRRKECSMQHTNKVNQKPFQNWFLSKFVL